MIDPAFKRALRHLRAVKSERPSEADSIKFSQWRERIAEALEAIASAAPTEKLQRQARLEAEAARAQARRPRGPKQRCDSATKKEREKVMVASRAHILSDFREHV
ncbi:hypothetical protein Q7689_07935 [Nocardiopsis tropica]|uniref:hypothetical protein n=1 Tax=Nocardiopsis tropica TaxID=109330 RepID=UPI002E86E65E|nr:hypothetical protein [Nocardiopsis tropica]